MDINKLTFISIKNYYKVLNTVGIVSDDQVYRLLLLSFIDDLFKDDFKWFINDKDYILLTNLVICLSKSTCVIPYIKKAIHINPIKNYIEDTPLKISEENIIRLTEENIFRLSDLY